MRYPLVLVLVILASGAAAPALAQQTFVVNSTADAVDATPGDFVCETLLGNGICTLRAAIQEASADADADTVTIPAGTFQLTIPGTFEDLGATGDLDVIQSLTINGAGAAATIIDGNSLDTVLDVLGGAFALRDLTLMGGDGGFTGAGGVEFACCSSVLMQRVIVRDNISVDVGGILLDGTQNVLVGTGRPLRTASRRLGHHRQRRRRPVHLRCG